MKYWIIAPYDSTQPKLFEQAWSYDLKNGTIAIGWAALGDVKSLSDKELKERISRLPYEVNDPEYIYNTFVKFYRQLSLGDVVIARKGVQQIIGFGEVVKTAYFNKEEGERRVPKEGDKWYLGANFIGVKWTIKTLSFTDIQLPRYPFVEVTPDRKYYNAILDFVKSEENGPGVVAPKAHCNNYLPLDKKKQIILYGPPGTGKTYHTKMMAVSFISGIDYKRDLIEYDELSDTDSKEEKREVTNPLFNKIESFVKTLSGIETVPRSSMIGYISFSKKLNKKIRLVWLSYPAQTTGCFKVYLRKEVEDTKYPQEVLKQIKTYKEKDWGDYPAFMVKNDGDAEKAITLIGYAYNNL